MTEKNKAQNEKDRADAYKLLSECYHPPDEKLLDVLNGSSWASEVLFPELAKDIPQADDLEAMKKDYARLFVGPFELLAPPYGSIYIEGQRQLMGQSTIEVQKMYRAEGLKLEMKEAHDHIAAELEFMYFLIFKQIEAVEKKEDKIVPGIIEKQKSFLRDYLGCWIGNFTRLIEKTADVQFYKTLASRTRSFIEKDLEYLLTAR